MADGRVDIVSLEPAALAAFFESIGEPRYRASQVFAWIHRGAASFEEMTDLSKALRAKLTEKAEINPLSVKKKLVSDRDNTLKYLYALADGEMVETVLMSYHYGNTVCISTQAGCRMNCAFCASSLRGLARNLLPSEMLGQVLATRKDSGWRIGNVVLMGIGEPLDNYDNVVSFLRILSAPGGINIGQRHISLSTCGLVDRIYDLIEERFQLTLSVSLHAPNNELRSRLMPVNRKYPIEELLRACRAYIEATKRRISFEYALIDGVNDTEACARELGARLRGMLCHVNLIPANAVAERGVRKSGEEKIRRFQAVLSGCGITATVRRTLGSDINASCGQLRLRNAAATGGELK